MKNYEFNVEKGEFYIYNPETGKNWYNQLWNNFGYNMTITHTGMVHSRYVADGFKSLQLDKPESNCLYIRDDNSGDYWNVGMMPVCNEVANYKCVHAMNWSEISSEKNGIKTRLAFTVSNKGSYEVWRTVLKNDTDKTANLSLFSGVEFDLNGYDQPAYYNAETTTHTYYDRDNKAILCLMKNPFRPHDNSTGFIMTSEPVAAYEGNYEKFIGTVGNYACPKIVKSGLDCTNSLATVRKRGGVLQNKITLQPGEEKTIYYVLGFCKGEADFKATANGIMNDARTAFDNVTSEGNARFGKLRTKSPEDRINNIMNFWAQKQVSYCRIGKKAVRDNAQLGMAMLNYDTDLAKITLTECLEHQFTDGHALLSWEYVSDRKNLYSDPPMWLILSVCEYIKETGDFDYLNEEVIFDDGPAQSVYQHLKLAAQWYLKPQNLGKNGLPKIHYADWNDALNIPDSDAESVFMSMSVCLAFSELAKLAQYLGEDDYKSFLLENKKKLAEATNKAAFNGDYYVRAISKFGKVGDKDSKGGKIYVNPQTWAVLSEVYEPENLDKILKSIDGMESEVGIPICAPRYEEYDETVGRMSGMLPGVYENAGVYNHACAFKIMADCKLKRTENATATLLKAIPDGKNNPSSITTTEPYVFTNCYLQHETVEMMVGSSWQTGTSAWILRDYYEGILGLKRDYEGMTIDPCIPKAWDSVYVERTFRGNLLKITYEQCGSDKITLFVDGKQIEGNVVPRFDDCNAHEVVVKL